MKIDRGVLAANDQNMGDFGDPDKLESSIKHLADVIDNNDNDTTALKTDNTTNKSNIATLQNNVSTLQTDNTSNKTRLTALETDNTSNKGRISTLETDNTSNKNRIATNENNIAYDEARLDNLLRNTQQASEVVDARMKADGTTFPLLKDRLNDIDSSLADIVPVNVKNFGAVGDKIADDTISINNAINQATLLKSANKKPVLFFPYAEGFKTTSPIVVPDGISVIMCSPIVYFGVDDVIILTIGTNANVNTQQELKLDVMQNIQSNWLSENNIGIKLINCNACDITIIRSQGSTIGLQCMGSGNGFSYNEVTLFTMLNNKIALDCTNELTGWCNENNWYAGRFAVFSGVNPALSRYGIRVTSLENFYNDNNLFIKPSFELKADSTAEAIPILIEYGNYNEFKSIRNEGNSMTVARIINNSTGNNISSGYGVLEASNIDDLSTYPTTFYSSRKNLVNQSNLAHVFSTEALQKKACYYDGATNINVPTVFLSGSANSYILNKINPISITDRYLDIGSTRGIGRFIDTALNKRFVIKKDVEVGYEGLIQINCFDASGNRLTSAGVNHPYVKGKSDQTPSYTTDWGGGYRTGAKTLTDFYFKVHDDVKYIQVLFCATSYAPLRIRGFSVHTLDPYHSSTWVGYEEIVPDVNLGSTPPTAGTWSVGRRIINGSPTVGQPKGWICTVAGTPGTWVSEGNL